MTSCLVRASFSVRGSTGLAAQCSAAQCTARCCVACVATLLLALTAVGRRASHVPLRRARAVLVVVTSRCCYCCGCWTCSAVPALVSLLCVSGCRWSACPRRLRAPVAKVPRAVPRRFEHMRCTRNVEAAAGGCSRLASVLTWQHNRLLWAVGRRLSADGSDVWRLRWRCSQSGSCRDGTCLRSGRTSIVQ